jgi:hypothetical protein
MRKVVRPASLRLSPRSSALPFVLNEAMIIHCSNSLWLSIGSDAAQTDSDLDFHSFQPRTWIRATRATPLWFEKDHPSWNGVLLGFSSSMWLPWQTVNGNNRKQRMSGIKKVLVKTCMAVGFGMKVSASVVTPSRRCWEFEHEVQSRPLLWSGYKSRRTMWLIISWKSAHPTSWEWVLFWISQNFTPRLNSFNQISAIQIIQYKWDVADRKSNTPLFWHWFVWSQHVLT